MTGPAGAAAAALSPTEVHENGRGARVHLVAADAADRAAAEAWGRALVAEGLVLQACDVEPPADDGRAPSPLVLFVGATLAPHLARLRTLHEQGPRRPLMVVVRGLRDLDQVLALEMGADDVIDAALAAAVAAARLRALARRVLAAAGPGLAPDALSAAELRFGALHLSRLERQVRLGGEVVPLTEGEFEVLWLLASRAGQAVSRRELLKQLRGLDEAPLDRSIDSRVYRIRAKLGDAPGGAARIRTVRHQGYAFTPSGW